MSRMLRADAHRRRARWVRRGLLGCLLAAALLAAPAAEAAIGTPTDLGSVEVDSSTATSLILTTTASAPAGASIIVTAASHPASGGAPQTSAACSDGAANGYATDLTRNDNGSITTICSTHQIAAALPSGSTITVSWSGGLPTDVWNQRIRAFAVSGLASAPLDRTASAVGTSLSPSSGATAATTQPDELLVGAITDRDDAVTAEPLTPGTNGTANDCAATGTPTYTALAGVGSANGPSLFALRCTVAATGAYTAQGTFPVSNTGWDALLATYKSATASTATALGSSQNPSTVGQPVTFTATVTGDAPTGTVTFKDGAATLGTGALNGGAHASFTTSSLGAGAHPFSAAYAGDGDNDPSSSPALTQTVNQAGSAPPGASPPAGENPSCRTLRKKLKRQHLGLAKASGEAKSAQIMRNIHDTRGRLRRRGC